MDIVDEAQAMLAEIEHKTSLHSAVPLHDLKGVLRRAAALLCRSKSSQTAIAHYLVDIPFEVFTKESIKMGISLWLGVIHENSRVEPRILPAGFSIRPEWQCAPAIPQCEASSRPHRRVCMQSL